MATSLSKRLGSAIVRTISGSSSASSDDGGSPELTPATTLVHPSPDPSFYPPPLSPIQRTVSKLSRLSLSPPRSDPFEQHKAELRKQQQKERKATEKSIAEFHSTITGAVFVGTVKYFKPAEQMDDRGVVEITVEGDENGGTGTSRQGKDIGVGVVDIQPKDPPSSKSSKSIHFKTFADYHNNHRKNEPLECFFDVFMKKVPREGTKISFLVTPGENGEYVAVACNVSSRYNRL